MGNIDVTAASIETPAMLGRVRLELSSWTSSRSQRDYERCTRMAR
eukprot:CAMPEP_0204203176 /NCGR_PEP_ID=MMETSP0361-20130328/68748_1 /ASSEMBLY_ACC=CAM_ASM_000343 /TAXON_ID=268821 /ORGANISM="Scrippsiella Hangoei, Strain SHTV-5" /LENGTH=44 /DNA_ID= /DNA_START= /DNA_END= /DNA_ORIENTATION=